jgi:hypothetical protein
VSRIAGLLGRYHRGEPMTEAEHQLLTTSIALRDDLESAFEIGGGLPPVDHKTLNHLRRALGGQTSVAVWRRKGRIDLCKNRCVPDKRRDHELVQVLGNLTQTERWKSKR